MSDATVTGRRGVEPAMAFWLSLGLVPVVLFAASQGGWALLLPPLASWGLFTALDVALGLDDANPDPQTDEAALRWHRAIVMLWAPVQLATLFGLIWWAGRAEHLGAAELAGLFFGMGILSGTVGITYAHELIHQQNRLERGLGDLLLASVLYGHFRTEHLAVHHRHVGTPRDPATARAGEGFWRFLARVLPQSLASAWREEADRQARRGRPTLAAGNPFRLYIALQAGALALAWLLGGGLGLALFAWQALVAVWQLELVNYVEHYGLTRRPLGGGRYEPVRPHHSWNASQRASNWLLINLQRHADHHVKPARRYPLLQTYGPDTAPQLPAGYPVMTLTALFPGLWRRIMDPRLAAWRARHYPEAAADDGAGRATAAEAG